MDKTRFRALIALLAVAVLGAVGLVALQPATAHAEPGVQYVIMGDSYASGTGGDTDKLPGASNPNAYDPATRTATNRCFRTNNAYGPQVAHALGLSSKFVACSGATIPQVLSGMFNEPSQTSHLSASTQYITLQAGGNDAGFVDVLQCIVIEANCGSAHAKFQQAYGVVNNSLPGLYDNLLSQVKSAAPNARIVLVGYPLILPEQSWQEMYMNASEKAAARQLRDGINAAMRAAANRHGATYVDPFAPGSPFLKANIGPGIQGPQSVIWGIRAQLDPVDVVGIGSSYHPTRKGQDYLAQLVKPALQ